MNEPAALPRPEAFSPEEGTAAFFRFTVKEEGDEEEEEEVEDEEDVEVEEDDGVREATEEGEIAGGT